MLWLVFAVLATALTLLFGVRTGVAVKERQGGIAIAGRALLTVMLLCAAVALWWGVATPTPAAQPDTLADSMPQATFRELEAETAVNDEDALKAISLTSDQLAEILNGRSLDLDRSSLNDYDEARYQAYLAYDVKMNDGLDFPATEILDAIKAGKTGAELDQIITQFINITLTDKLMTNPVLTYEYLMMLSEDPVMTRNNPWIIERFAQYQKYYDDPASFANRTVECGLDFSIERKPGGASDEYVVTAFQAETGALLRETVKAIRQDGITERTCDDFGRNNMESRDSMRRSIKASYAESRKAIYLPFFGKQSNALSEYGINLIDITLMRYNPETPEKVTPPADNTPPKTTNPPKDTPTVPKDDPEPVLPPPTNPDPETNPKLVVRYHFVMADDTSVEVFPMETELKDPYAEYSKTVPQKYGLKSDRDVITGKMGTTDKDEWVYYTPIKHWVDIDYIHAYTGQPVASPVHELKKVGEHFRFVSPNLSSIGLYYDIEVIEDDMEDRDMHFVVKYYPRSTPTPTPNPDPTPTITNPKDPSRDPAPSGDAPIGGGTVSGITEYEPEKTPEINYPKPEDLPWNQPTTSDKPLTPTDPKESTGQDNGNVDHPIVDPNGGKTSGGTPPAKEEIPVTNGTTVTDTTVTVNPDGTTVTDSTHTNTSDESTNTATLEVPD